MAQLCRPFHNLKNSLESDHGLKTGHNYRAGPIIKWSKNKMAAKSSENWTIFLAFKWLWQQSCFWNI
jgi:hypothetical protein